jgi:hypothetical protein
LNFNPFLPIGTFPEFSQNSFEKGQVVACSYSKEFCSNPNNESTARKEL